MRKKGAELVFLGELPDGEEVIDFYHAAGHLDTALAAAYGDTHPKRRAQFEKQRHVLLEDYKGVEKVIRSLVHLRDTYPRRKKIARELKYFRRNRHRMRYAALKEQGLPIGSGVTEAACKTLSNATHEEVRNAMGRARRPSHSILPRSRAEQSLRASLDPARTYLQGGGYDSRQCRADTQLAMIGVSMRVTLKRFPTKMAVGIFEPAIMLDLELVLGGGEIGISFSPEGLNEAVALFERAQRQENLSFTFGDDVDDVALDPELVLGGELVDALIGGSERRQDRER